MIYGASNHLGSLADELYTEHKWIPRTQFRRRMQLNAGTVPSHHVACACKVGYSHRAWFDDFKSKMAVIVRSWTWLVYW